MVDMLLILLAVMLPASDRDPFMARITDVLDGNTVEAVGTGGEIYTLVLTGIDAPESDQEYGQAAKRFLERKALRKDVTVMIRGKDRSGKLLAVVLLKDDVDIRHLLLEEGLAWTAEKDPDPVLEAIRVKAEAAGKGLWKTVQPVPPWIFRRQQSMLTPKSR